MAVLAKSNHTSAWHGRPWPDRAATKDPTPPSLPWSPLPCHGFPHPTVVAIPLRSPPPWHGGCLAAVALAPPQSPLPHFPPPSPWTPLLPASPRPCYLRRSATGTVGLRGSEEEGCLTQRGGFNCGKTATTVGLGRSWQGSDSNETVTVAGQGRLRSGGASEVGWAGWSGVEVERSRAASPAMEIFFIIIMIDLDRPYNRMTQIWARGGNFLLPWAYNHFTQYIHESYRSIEGL